MKKTRIIKNILASVLICSGFSSCSDWLEVKMTDKIMESTLYTDYDGYLTALNGVYLGMNDLYTNYMSAGIIDVMAQYYYVTENNDHAYKIYAGYKYNDTSFESMNTSIWGKFYTLLANVNVILEHTEDGVLTNKEYAIIRGESLALRAFLHFDLLRLYGPIYSEDSSTECIPYQDTSKRTIQPFLPASQVVDKILADLAEAEQLLQAYDPIIDTGTQNISTVDNGVASYDYCFRQLRLNYYAVKLLQARVNLWKGDKTKAYQIAKNEIIDKITTEKLEVFPWVTTAQINAVGKPDYLFSSEVFFSLYHSSRYSSLYSALFSPSLAMSSRLTFVGSSLTGDESKVGTFYDDENDYRKAPWALVEPTDTEQEEAANNNTTASPTICFNKYADFTSEASSDGVNTYRYMIPLMRLSEVYLIAAECASSADEELSYINTLRMHRNCQNLGTGADLDQALTNEFAREMIGEGQLFFFYKRRAMTSLISGYEAGATYEMSKSNYVWPIPQSELSKRATVGEK